MIAVVVGIGIGLLIGGAFAVRALLLPPVRRTVRKGWKPERD